MNRLSFNNLMRVKINKSLKVREGNKNKRSLNNKKKNFKQLEEVKKQKIIGQQKRHIEKIKNDKNLLFKI